MLKFISFGSGSSGNCYLLYTETDALLIDVGVGIRTLKKHFHDYGVTFDQIHHVLLTHDHADHVKSVGSISRDYNLPVYTTHKVHVGIERNYCVRQKISPELAHVIDKDVTFCLMTDIGHMTDEMLAHVSQANYLVIEANHDKEMLRTGPYPQYLKERIAGPKGHLSNVECATALAEHATALLKHVWLCHLSEDNNHPELARKTVEQVLRSYGIVSGVDFQLDVLKRKSPSEIFELT